MQTARKALPLALSIALGLGMVHGVAAQSKTGNPQAENLRESLTRGVAKPAAGGEAAPSGTGAV
ncbi:peptidase, partial [Burkholderia gladioli]|nr:peptidase [Burkholderia gladioli]